MRVSATLNCQSFTQRYVYVTIIRFIWVRYVSIHASRSGMVWRWVVGYGIYPLLPAIRDAGGAE